MSPNEGVQVQYPHLLQYGLYSSMITIIRAIEFNNLNKPRIQIAGGCMLVLAHSHLQPCCDFPCGRLSHHRQAKWA